MVKTRLHGLTLPIFCVFVDHSDYPPAVVGEMNEHINAYTVNSYPTGSIEWLSDAYDEADVRDPKASAVKHRVSLRHRSCSCCKHAEDDTVCEHLVESALFAGMSAWSLVPERYTVAEWRTPYDAIADTGGGSLTSLTPSPAHCGRCSTTPSASESP